jgi:ABC-type iron transport system FetAB permease component
MAIEADRLGWMTTSGRPAMKLVLLGALLGLAWAAGLRGYMTQLTDESTVDWFGTFGLVLLPGVVTGALLG